MSDLSKSTDPYDPDILKPYWLALGEFAFYFARLEHEMHMIVSKIAFGRSNPGIARAVLQGRRMRDEIDILGRISKEIGSPFPHEFQEGLSQANAINTRRNDILHYGLQIDEQGAFISNEHRVSIDSLKVTRASVDDLRNMTEDVVTIWARVVIFLSVFNDIDPKDISQEWHYLAKRAWQYKSPQPVRLPSNSRNAKRKRVRPRQSSRD